MFTPTVKHLLAPMLVVGLVAACGLIEPKETEPNPNSPPTVVLTAYPPNVYDHTVTFHWKGQDSDGIVMYYETSVDGGAWHQTTRTDTTIVFSVVDNATHTFAVRAYDDDGAVSAPAERSFTATSIAPETILKVAPAQNAVVGPAITVELDADDPDDVMFTWRYKIDEGEWSAWRADSAFAFADASIIPGAFDLLPVGTHTFYGQARDASGLVDPTPASVSFVVAEGTQPLTSVTVSQINGAATYADYSAFTAVDRKNAVHLEIAGDASAYGGVLAGFASIWCKAESLATASFSPWLDKTVYDFTNVEPGQYWFIIKARDTAGHEDSTPESLLVDIVDPRTDLNPASILLVQETRNGTGSAGSPTVAAVNEYYATMLAGRQFTTVDYATLAAGGRYLSAHVGGRYGLIIWVDDDRSEHWMFSHPENMKFLREYTNLKARYSLPQPTHVLMSHWNLPGASNVDLTFLTEVFGVTSPSTNGNGRTFVAAQGQGPLAGMTLQVDAAKLPNTAQGKLSQVWAMETPAGGTTLTTWVSAEQDTMSGRSNAYYYPGTSAEVVLTGYPLYFMTGAPAFMDRVLQLMGF